MFPRLPLLALVPALAVLAAGAQTESAPEDGVADQMFQRLQSLRKKKALPPVQRLEELDRVAGLRAGSIAGAPPERRLPLAESLDELIERESDLQYRMAFEQVDLHHASDDPLSVADRAWPEQSPSRELVEDPRVEAVGLAARQAQDGTLVIVAVFIQQRFIPQDLRELEHRTEREINQIRKQHGLTPLAGHPGLRDVARAHSEDMVRREFFDHHAPDGLDPGDRVRERGIPFLVVLENIGQSPDMADPVAAIVEHWMNSPGHRANVLDPRVRQTGVGVAEDDGGMIYFTQLFLQPSARESTQRRR